MDVIVEFNEAAFRHKISKEDILYALKAKIFDAAIQELPEKRIAVGLNRAGNPLEIMYNPMDDTTINVFHAMKLRNSVKDKLGL